MASNQTDLPSLPTISPQIGTQSASSATVDTIWGVQLDDHDEIATSVARLHELGVHWVRVNLRWRDVEPAPADTPSFDWTKPDALFNALHDAGINSIADFRDNPSNVAANSCGPINPGDTPKLARFLQAAAARYTPLGAKYWEMYNEPDNRESQSFEGLGGCFGNGQAQNYVDMLHVAYPAIKQGSPDAQVLLGGVGYEKFDGSPFNDQFTEDILKMGAGDYVDLLNFHFYPAFAYNWEEYGVDLTGKSNALRKLMEQYKLRKPIVLTEVGTPTAGPDKVGYSEAKTARYLVQAFSRAASTDMPVVIWFTLSDQSTDIRAYGLIDANGNPKQPYRAFQNLTRELKGMLFLRALDSSETATKDVEGYVFRMLGGSQRIVAWANKDGNYSLRLTAASLHIDDLYGKTTVARDGSPDDADGKTDGVVEVRLGLDPIFVSAQ